MTEKAIKKREIEIGEGGLVKLDSYESAFQFAQSVVKSGLAPDSFKTPEAILVAMQQGAELGLKPMQSLQHIAVINGRPSIYGKAATGIVMQSGLVELFEEWFEGSGDNLTAICKVKRKGLPSVKTAKFSMADAKKANLTGKEVWRKYTNDMLMYKARARAFTIFNDVLCGLSFAEDILEVPGEKISFAESKQGNNSDPLLEELDIVEVKAEEVEPEPIQETELESEPTTKEEKIIRIRQWVLTLAGDDKNKAKQMLMDYTSFTGKDGNEVSGVDTTKALEKFSEKRLNTTYGKIKKEFEEVFPPVDTIDDLFPGTPGKPE
jgi:hypothetical protein